MVTKRGPKTDDGRAAVRLNAVRHGVLATTPVIPGLESAEDWEAHVAGISESLEPVGYLEAVLVARLAVTLWRLQRVVRFEQEVIAVQQQEIAERVEERESGAERWRTLMHLPSARVAHAQETLARRDLLEQRIRGELLLPEAKGLEKLVRYEAHLNRQFYQALHEVEALQTRRRGGQAPLARLDVHGMPDASS
jgi:hypothetical protein